MGDMSSAMPLKDYLATGAIPKPNSNKIRLIHDYSRPFGRAVNDMVDNRPFSYQSLQQALTSVTPGAWMAKQDLASAYRQVKIHQSDQEVTALAWTFKGDEQPMYMYDTRLMFGACPAPSIFNDLSQEVVTAMKERGFHIMFGVTALNTLWSLSRKLRFSISYNKITGPSTSVACLVNDPYY